MTIAQSRGGQALLLVVGGWVAMRLIVLAAANGGVPTVAPVGLPGGLPGGPTGPSSGGVVMVPLIDPVLDLPLQLPLDAMVGAVEQLRRTSSEKVEPIVVTVPAPRDGGGPVATSGGWGMTLAGGSPALGRRLQLLTIARLMKAGGPQRVGEMLDRMSMQIAPGPMQVAPTFTQVAPPNIMGDSARVRMAPAANRWSADLFAFFRGGRVARSGAGAGSGMGTGTGPGASGGAVPGSGILGTTQHAAILRYRIDQRRRIEAFVRLTSVGDPPRGEAIAAGVAVQPVRAVPLRIIAERRQRIGDAGRSAAAIYVAGGGRVQAGRWQVDGYGAGGVVGARQREAFAEAALRATTPVLRLGNFDLAAGAGSWAAAQRGVARVDVGPTLVMQPRIPAAPTLALDWRTRVTGDAAPARGAALTVSMSF